MSAKKSDVTIRAHAEAERSTNSVAEDNVIKSRNCVYTKDGIAYAGESGASLHLREGDTGISPKQRGNGK